MKQNSPVSALLMVTLRLRGMVLLADEVELTRWPVVALREGMTGAVALPTVRDKDEIKSRVEPRNIRTALDKSLFQLLKVVINIDRSFNS